MLAIPAVIEAGAETPFCASLMEPNETMAMIVTLRSQEQNLTLMEETANEDFHKCKNFRVC